MKNQTAWTTIIPSPLKSVDFRMDCCGAAELWTQAWQCTISCLDGKAWTAMFPYTKIRWDRMRSCCSSSSIRNQLSDEDGSWVLPNGRPRTLCRDLFSGLGTHLHAALKNIYHKLLMDSDEHLRSLPEDSCSGTPTIVTERICAFRLTFRLDSCSDAGCFQRHAHRQAIHLSLQQHQ